MMLSKIYLFIYFTLFIRQHVFCFVLFFFPKSEMLRGRNCAEKRKSKKSGQKTVGSSPCVLRGSREMP